MLPVARQLRKNAPVPGAHFHSTELVKHKVAFVTENTIKGFHSNFSKFFVLIRIKINIFSS